MKVSREGDYGLRAVAYLAGQNGRVVSATEISREQGIPQKFLARIMPKLVKKQILVSIPGSKGGYQICKAASQVNFLEVLTAVEGPMKLNECLDEVCDCSRKEICSLKKVWELGQQKLQAYFATVTFDQLKESARNCK